MPIGTNKYMGLGLPPIGNAVLKGQSTEDILTLEHSTLDQGNFLIFRNELTSLDVEFTTNASDIIRFDGGGGITGVTGLNTQTGFKRTIVDTSVSATLTVAQSGTLFVVSSVAVSTMKLVLPVGSDVPGTWYEFWVSSGSGVSSRVRIAASSDVAAKIHGYGQGTSDVSTFPSITPESALADQSFFVRVTAMTSLLWVMQPHGGYTSDASTLTRGQWIAGSTT